MSESFKKIDKTFRLGDSSLNSYSFRLLTSGYMIDEFKKNPVGYYMHGTEEFPRDAGVLLRWEDLKIAGDNITGTPVVNLSHPRGERTLQEINSGFLSAASMGHFVVLEVSDEPGLKLPGQTGPTVTKWYNRECSVVDIPGNFNAYVLYDKNEHPLKISDLKGMSSTVLPTLPTSIQDTPIQPETNPALQPEIDINDLLGKAFSNKLINEGTLHVLKAQYRDNPENLPAILKGLANAKCELSLRNKIWCELDTAGELESLKVFDPVGYEMKYIETFGKASGTNNLSAAEAATVQSNANAARVELLQRLAAMSWEEVVNANQLSYLKDNDPILYAAKAQYRFGSENPIVKEKALDRQKINTVLAAEKQHHINRLNSKSFNELDHSGELPTLKTLSPALYREKFKVAFGKYPK